MAKTNLSISKVSGTDLNSKNRTILLSNAFIIVAIVIIVVISNSFLTPLIQNEILKTILLIFIALLFYFIFASQIISKNDNNLQDMIKNTLHELNTPIATIKANATMLEKNLIDEKDKNRLKRIQQASQNLLKLYENMEYKIKKEIDFVELSSFDIKEVVTESISKFEDIKGDIVIENLLRNYMITTDKIGFEQVIDNLISNAIKYNKANGFVKIYLETDKLIFEDSGKGIDTKSLFIIFDRYYQQDSNTEGFGLGLSIVKEFCDKYKIDIKIDSKEKIGTKIVLDLKLL